MGIFRADVDVALAGADRDGRDRHALDHHEGIALHDHAVGKGAAVALVGIADDVFAVGAGLRHRLPLDAGREAGAATAAQAGGGDFGQDAVGTKLQCPLKALVALVSPVVLDRARIDHAAAGEGQAGLAFEPGNLFRDAKSQGVGAVRDHGVEHGRHVALGERAERDAPLRRCDLDHRLQPIQAARAGPDDLDGNAAARSRLLESEGHLVGADRDRAGVAGHENPQIHRCASATSASMRASSSRPTIRPSSIADGAVAHSPRQ